MNIIWTNLKLAFWRERFLGPVAVVSFYAFKTLVDARDPIDPRAEITSLQDYPWFFALVGSFILSGVPYAVWIQERETTAKPLSFCLPEYRPSLRWLILLAALPWGLFLVYLEASQLWGWAYFTRGVKPEPLNICLRFAGAFMVGVATYMGLRGSRLVLSRLQWGILALASFPLGIVALVIWLGIDTHATASRVAGGLVAMVVFVFFWVRLGNMQYVARGHRIIIDDAMDKRAQAGVKRTTPPWAGEFFLLRMELCSYLGAWRYLWGSLYQAFGRALSYWKWILAGVFLASLALGYAPGSFTQLAFVFLGIGVSHVELPATSSMLLPGGRRERYHATVIAAVVASLLLLAIACVVAGSCELIAVVLGADVGNFGVRLGSVWVVCVGVPWICAAQFPGYGLAPIRIASMVIWAGAVGLMAFSVLSGSPKWPAEMRFPVFASVCLCGWAVFLLTSRHVCMRGALVEQSARAGG